MEKLTILITGASGFLGTWLADQLWGAGYEIVGVDLRAPLKPEIWSGFVTSSTDHVEWDSLLEGKSLFAVAHLAGGASVALSVNDPYSDFSNLVPGTARLALYILRHHANAKFILFSSAAVYGNAESLPFSSQTPLLPISPYGIHKLLAESLLESYSRVYGLNVLVLRIFSVYGPGLRKQMIWDVANRALKAASDGNPVINLFGTGDETRDFIYVKDLCAAVEVLLIAKSESKFEVLNLASGVESSIKEIASHLITHLGVPVEFNFDGNIPKGDPFNMRADIAALRSKGVEIKYSLEDGLQEVAHWIKSINN